MADSNPLQKFQAALAADPTLKGCVYEILIRGSYGAPGTMGTITGAHFQLMLQGTNPLGEVQEYDTGKLPAALISGVAGTPLAKLIPVALVAQQQTIDAQTKTLAEQDAQVKTLTGQVEGAQASITDLTNQAAAAQASIADLTARLAAATAPVEPVTA